MEISTVLNPETKVFGFFSGVEVAFSVGNCVRNDFCIKIMNLQKIDEEKSDEVPSTTCIGDSRLVLTGISKSDIREYFSNEKTEKKSQKQQRVNSNKDFRRANHSINH